MDTLIIYPTLAAAVHVNANVDLGFGLQDAIGVFKLANLATTTALGDAGSLISATSYFNPILTVGALLHLPRGFDLGAHLRSAANLGAKQIEASGTLTATTPGGAMLGKEVPATFTTSVPWVFRLGLRYAHVRGGREVFDVELDGVYEVWSANAGHDALIATQGKPVSLPGDMSQNLNVTLTHHYRDTYSVRLGGAYNWIFGGVELTGRLGFYFDSAATDSTFTRLDFNTLAKLAGTAGLGLRYRGVQLNVAYAYVQSLDRTVADGQIQAIDGLTGQATGPAINNGLYQGKDQIVSAGLLVQFDELVKGARWARKPVRTTL